MARAYKCDICDNLFGDHVREEVGNYFIGKFDKNVHGQIKDHKFDICPVCYNGLIKFMTKRVVHEQQIRKEKENVDCN